MEFGIRNRAAFFAHARLAERAICFNGPIVLLALDHISARRRRRCRTALTSRRRRCRTALTSLRRSVARCCAVSGWALRRSVARCCAVSGWALRRSVARCCAVSGWALRRSVARCCAVSGWALRRSVTRRGAVSACRLGMGWDGRHRCQASTKGKLAVLLSIMTVSSEGRISLIRGLCGRPLVA